jgi:hypothetical protein
MMQVGDFHCRSLLLLVKVGFTQVQMGWVWGLLLKLNAFDAGKRFFAVDSGPCGKS